jgi:hypothetical protein
MDMRFGTWNVRNMYGAGLFRTVAEEMSKYKLGLVGVWEVRWYRGSTEPSSQYTFFYGKGNENHELGKVFFFYIILRGCWCDIIILNVHAPTEDKNDGMKDRFYEDLVRVFNKFPKYCMKILLDFNAKVSRKDIF